MNVTDTPWNDILKIPPQQDQRILVKTLGGQVRIVSYDRFDYNHWAIAAWKAVPDEQRQRTS